jgi:hypothetical protein
MPTPAEIEAMPTTPGSVIRARANGSHQIHAWELGADRRWYRYNDRRSPGNLNLIEILHVEPPTDGTERAA